jgi:hypothetical protein
MHRVLQYFLVHIWDSVHSTACDVPQSTREPQLFIANPCFR